MVLYWRMEVNEIRSHPSFTSPTTYAILIPMNNKTLSSGNYEIPVSLSGGSGRAGIASPAPVHIKAGKTTAEITWSSGYYDYMKVDGRKYLKVNKKGNSRFDIPVKDLNKPLHVIGDTTAMTKPHEISYTIRFDTARAKRTGAGPLIIVPVLAAIVIAVIAAGLFIRKERRH